MKQAAVHPPTHAPGPSLLTRLRRSIRRRGVRGALRRATRRLRTGWLEWRLGITTAGSIDARELGAEGARYGYQPIEHHSFWRAMEQLQWRPDDVFADIGCGMGRAVILAARLGFRRVIGVEHSETLCETARANVRRARRHLKSVDIEILRADATTLDVPDDLTVVFMYNPFSGDVMQAFLERLRESLRRRPRSLRIVYATPLTDVDSLAECPWLRRTMDVATDNQDWERINIYQNSVDELAAAPAGGSRACPST